jgi:hypothetical protein
MSRIEVRSIDVSQPLPVALLFLYARVPRLIL